MREDPGQQVSSDADVAVAELETECAELRRRVGALEARVRLRRSAGEFLSSRSRVREGDYCVIDGHPTRVQNIGRDGKWTYFNGNNLIEPFRVPPSDDVRRLYTEDEVAEIVAVATAGSLER